VQAVSPPPDGGYPGGNTAEGTNALLSLTSGIWNTGTGFEALSQLTAGNQNTATGLRALANDTNGGFNTATGVFSLFSNTSGFFNSATGAYSLANNVSGTQNTATGYGALYRNTDDDNTATGYAALFRNTTGSINTANGAFALNRNTFGSGNTANGYQALYYNTGGSNTGNFNTAIGDFALYQNATGSLNTAVGDDAGYNITGSGNVCIGAGVTGGIGENDTTRIRNVYTTVQPVVGMDPDYVTVNSSGRLGRANVSSRRYKHDIKPMDKASEALFALKPVSFRYNKDYDATQTLAFGLIAEEVAEVYPELVGRNGKGEPESVRYDQINAMLLNEFLKEHGKVEQQSGNLENQASKIKEQETTIAQLKSDAANQQATVSELKKGMEIVVARLREQDSKIQKVSAQFEVNKPLPQVVLNKP